MTKIVYLVGRNLAHSLSPTIWNSAFTALGIDARYELLDVTTENLYIAEDLLRRRGCLGGNVTMPYKSWAVTVADCLDHASRTCSAANVLATDSNGLTAFNTDALGMSELLAQVRGSIEHEGVLIVGTGGAALATLWALGRIAPRELIIACRHRDAGERLAAIAVDQLPSTDVSIQDLATLRVNPDDVQLVVNATSVGMGSASEDPLPWFEFSGDSLLYDFVYRRDGFTSLQARALRTGAKVVDGAGHLYEQALPTFRVLTQLEPPREVMMDSLVGQIGRSPLRWA